VKKELEAAGVKPALDPETVGATFFGGARFGPHREPFGAAEGSLAAQLGRELFAVQRLPRDIYG
jgi:hypothetical protein